MEIGINLVALTHENVLVRIRLITRHIVVRMITRNHHHRDKRHVLDLVFLELRNHILKTRPALNRVHKYILVAECIELCLNHSIVCVRDMRCAMCHDENGIILFLLGELARECLDELDHIIRLLFLPLPVHEGRAARHRLELILVAVEHPSDIGILHARDDIKRDESHTRVTVRLELLECLLRGRVLHTLLLCNAIDDDMGGECRHNLHARVSRLDRIHRRFDRLLSCLLERRSKARHNDGILVRIVPHLRVLILQNANFRRLHQGRCHRFHLGIELIRSFCRAVGKSKDRRAGERSDQHFLPILHPNSSQNRYK